MNHEPKDGDREKVTDPVCNMTFVAKKAVATADHAGVTYHFCTEACKNLFTRDPERYVART